MFLNICKLLTLECYVFFRVLMKQLVIAERFCLVVILCQWLAGLLLVVHAEVILNLGGRLDDRNSMEYGWGGVVYMVLGAVAVAFIPTDGWG